MKNLIFVQKVRFDTETPLPQRNNALAKRLADAQKALSNPQFEAEIQFQGKKVRLLLSRNQHNLANKLVDVVKVTRMKDLYVATVKAVIPRINVNPSSIKMTVGGITQTFFYNGDEKALYKEMQDHIFASNISKSGLKKLIKALKSCKSTQKTS